MNKKIELCKAVYLSEKNNTKEIVDLNNYSLIVEYSNGSFDGKIVDEYDCDIMLISAKGKIDFLKSIIKEINYFLKKPSKY